MRTLDRLNACCATAAADLHERAERHKRVCLKIERQNEISWQLQEDAWETYAQLCVARDTLAILKRARRALRVTS